MLPLNRFHDAEGRLRREFTDFATALREVREVWKDERREQFERDHLEPLGPSLQRFGRELTELTRRMREADNELADRESPHD